MKATLKTWLLVGLLVAGGGLTGCVAQGEADDLRTLYRKSQEQIIDLQAQLEEANSRIAALQNAGVDSAQLEELLTERDRLQAALDAAEQQLREAGRQAVVLPKQLDTALRDLAGQYPELMTYDPQRGMVKFQSDLTFDRGSAKVSDAARQTLVRLAQVLTTPAAGGYEVRVVGHTDALPVNNPVTKARHPNNWYLSVHRAISVRRVLERAGVVPTRLGVAGYGQYRPIVPNGPNGAAEQNRRVEIYLVPMSPVTAEMPAGSEQGSPGAGSDVVHEANTAPEMYK